MFATLFFAECCGMFTAMSIVAWLGDPAEELGPGRTLLLRFFAPPVAVVLGLMTLSALQDWLMGEPIQDQPPGSWVIIGGVFLAVAITMAVAAVRPHQTNRRWLGSQERWSRDSVVPSQRRYQRPRKARKRPE